MYNNLRKYRSKVGLTQKEIAKKINTTVRNYQYYESGERLPNVITAQRIASALGTTVEKLFPYKA
ncbi:helix-turn-helix transcriptional regulator [Paenibacillus larvae]